VGKGCERDLADPGIRRLNEVGVGVEKVVKSDLDEIAREMGAAGKKDLGE
jgi:hypothetical protein